MGYLADPQTTPPNGTVEIDRHGWARHYSIKAAPDPRGGRNPGPIR